MGLAIFLILAEALTIALGVAAIVVVQRIGKKPKVTAGVALGLAVLYCWSIFPTEPIYRHLCKKQSGQFIAERVKTDSYLLVGEGGDRFDGLGLNTALDDLVAKRIKVVEIQKPHNNLKGVASNLLGIDVWSREGRQQWEKPGVYRLSISDTASKTCRIYSGGNHPFGKRLNPNECITLSEIDRPDSRYAVMLFERTAVPLIPIKNFGVMIEDRSSAKQIARISVFEHIPRPLFVMLFGDKDIWCPASRLQRQPRMTQLHGQVLFGAF